ncbi:MAG: TetR family transcriptional regulator C-terminal domain-containing protein [Rhodobiaceae bacterium]|nr:TetR family transcriptional regulator C-terminal domain-containing protein [Rhodobiaceae bacterium]
MQATTKSPPAGTMPARPRKERSENAARRRGQLIAATTKSIVENGLARTTLATVSAASGLSQGVAVFYFANKEKLFAEVLRHHYELYERLWVSALAQAGDDPVRQLAALIRADFDPAACNQEALIVWYAFWGEAKARPRYAEISDIHDSRHSDAIRAACARLLIEVGRSQEEADALGAGIEALTDGLWHRIYLSHGTMSAREGLRLAARFVANIFPERGERLSAEILGTAQEA